MQNHCRICGEPLTGKELECPNCHFPLEPSSSVKNKDTEEVRMCPRCGEILMPGVDVCEVCGEVVNPLPKVIRCAETKYDISENQTLRTEIQTQPGNKKTDNKVSLGALIVICILVAAIAGLITWTVIHFCEEEKPERVESLTNNSDLSVEDREIGTIAPESFPQSTTMPSVKQQDEIATQSDNTPEPIEGMKESFIGSYTFQGKVNNKFSIGIDMRVSADGQITGCYWYDSTLRKDGDVPSTFISLVGEVDDTGHVTLEAQKNDESVPSEHWSGTLSGVRTIIFKGSFRSVSKGSTYSFNCSAHNPHYHNL